MQNSIRTERETRGWTQAELGQRLGVSRQTVNAIETGKYDPSLPLAFRLAAVFDQRIEQLFTPDA
jgi:putative transcriptional regulator